MLSGGCCDQQAEWDATACGAQMVIECLTAPPDGMGPPNRRTEDLTYAQRGGVRHFNDYYEPRIITIVGTVGPNDAMCEDCADTRRQLNYVMQAFKLTCEDVEMVIYPPCWYEEGDGIGFGEGPFGEGPFGGEETFDRTLIGPFGVIGRPRSQPLNWISRKEQAADFTLVFECVDEKMYVLDRCGTPGYEECVEIEPGSEVLCRTYPRCYTGGSEGTWCYTETVTEDSVEPVEILVGGTECVFPKIVLMPDLTSPRIENITTGDYISYRGVVDYPVEIDTENMTATSNGESRTHLLDGTATFNMQPGQYELRLVSQSKDDDGYATFCWRNTVIMA